mmetsp:Transcript_32986/g.57989  ORF Transcript_32986/g.57989 Transcript_32986/m.57989 type:complete len:354 (+) Transcript_32986:2285-3346(+)
MCDVQHQISFAMKSVFNKQPYMSAGVFAGLIVLLFGMLMRVFERSVSNDFSYIWNGFWLIGITIPTLGYGNIVPSTHIGRAICGMSAILGLYAVSYAVNAVQTSFTLSDLGECSIAASIEYKQKLTLHTKSNAAILIQRYWRLLAKRKKNETRLLELARYNSQFEKFSGFRAKWLKIQDPKLNEVAMSIERATSKEFVRTFKHLQTLKDSKLVGGILKTQACSFEICSTKYANVIRSLFDSCNPRRRASAVLTAFDPTMMKIRKQKSKQRSKMLKESTTAVKQMMKRITTRSSRNPLSPGSGESSRNNESPSSFNLTSQDDRSPSFIQRNPSYLSSESQLSVTPSSDADDKFE